VSHVVYANVSGSDRDGFARSLGFDPRTVHTPGLRECGHTFASDLVLNYSILDERSVVKPGEWVLFAAAGIGFTWGVTLARA
jgi:3-oxoacyl-[acyl-carrier-protein] synthase III